MSTESLSVDKSESVAAVASNSESVAPSVKAATAAQKKTKKSKTKVKAVVAAVAAAQELTEAESISNLTVDHPYLSVLYKRIRSHRKKLEKIKSLELAQLEEGKKPNAQQLELMGSKSTLEKLVAELEMLREQFVGVYTEEMEKKKAVEAEEETTAPVKPVEEKEESETIAEQEELTPEGEQETQEVQETAQQVVEDKEQDFARVFELLKTLHVVNLHQALGKEVPMVLDFFSKVLLGNTRPPAELSYEENLMESLEEAKKYLTASDKLFACDTTYSGLRTLETSDVPVVPAEINTMPQISFFTESQLEEEAEQTEVTAQSVPAAPLSFAAVTAGVTSERTPSPPQKSSRRRGQGRWREKNSNSNSGNKSGSPTNGGKPRRPRAPRTNDENSNVQGGKRSGSKENRRPRVDRTLRKQPNSTQHSTPMIAPHA
ncbi:uncharacterized protein PITG_08138 [Phytophthora infestans T30-4]|uniref:Uncharacterized protein n=1 Tax=Phytophthora infestans (strain T30-4) TaxID=403677 RepID=D0N9J7_PHYIT|nr:uncharacterized protein PITG_08138 [Phytophthora infestans T30-4]EEY54485.1 conserved hypothetical protein [Phytophthora infestans T30-4]|eukprot:XP_002904307.1 conserved hypothetical protein [Phytophthora infestans T30-4]